jgi:hypothetical protein
MINIPMATVTNASNCFIIEVICEEDQRLAGNEQPAPTISLHALTEIQPRSGRTMQVLVMVNDVFLTTLLYSSSTHNFSNTEFVWRAGIQLSAHSGLRVAVVNDNRLLCSGCSPDMEIAIGDELFMIACYGLSLGSYEMVFGVQWQESLGPIVWDFASRTMAFVRDGHRIVWSATSMSSVPPLLCMASINVMDDLLQHFAPS